MGGRLLAVALVLVASAVGCSGDDDGGSAESAASEESADTTTTTAPPRTAVDVSQAELRPIDEGAGVSMLAAEELPEGYVEEELLLSGVAGTYRGAPNAPATPTGQEIEYTTRLVVRYPSDPAAFSGRAVVEPLNTSGGADADVIWRQIAPMLAESGDVWVGVTVR